MFLPELLLRAECAEKTFQLGDFEGAGYGLNGTLIQFRFARASMFAVLSHERPLLATIHGLARAI